MKKVFVFFIAFIFCASIIFVSCGENMQKSGSEKTPADLAEETSETESTAASNSAESPNKTESSISGIPDEPAEVIYDVNDYGKLGIEENDGNIQFIRAFLNKDTEKLEQFCNLKKGMYDDLKTLELGKYSISRYEGSSTLIFNFTVLSSKLETLPAGEYSYYVEYGVDSMEMTPVNQVQLTTLQENIRKWLVESDYLYKDFSTLNEDEKTQFRFRVTYFLLWQYGDMTLEELQHYAFELFHMENFQPHESAGMLVDGKYTLLGRGGNVWRYDFAGERKENDKTFVTVQFYADACGFIKSHLIEYEMQEKDGKWAFISSKITAESPYEPYHSGV